jgi:ribosomal-protein-alanine N-acetyltransferase
MNYNLETKRLILKQPEITDVATLFDLMSSYVDTTYLSWEPHNSIETTENLVANLIEAQKQDKGYHWCIYHENTIVGIVSLIDVKRQLRTWVLNRAELSYWIAKPLTGNGFATEAAQAVLDFGFNQLSFHKIIIAHTLENIESQRICQKLGFTKYALEHDAFMKNQKWYDLVWYELLKE